MKNSKKIEMEENITTIKELQCKHRSIVEKLEKKNILNIINCFDRINLGYENKETGISKEKQECLCTMQKTIEELYNQTNTIKEEIYTFFKSREYDKGQFFMNIDQESRSFVIFYSNIYSNIEKVLCAFAEMHALNKTSNLNFKNNSISIKSLTQIVESYEISREVKYYMLHDFYKIKDMRNALYLATQQGEEERQENKKIYKMYECLIKTFEKFNKEYYSFIEVGSPFLDKYKEVSEELFFY